MTSVTLPQHPETFLEDTEPFIKITLGIQMFSFNLYRVSGERYEFHYAGGEKLDKVARTLLEPSQPVEKSNKSQAFTCSIHPSDVQAAFTQHGLDLAIKHVEFYSKENNDKVEYDVFVGNKPNTTLKQNVKWL